MPQNRRKFSRSDERAYARSNAVAAIRVPEHPLLQSRALAVATALTTADRGRVEIASQRLLDLLCLLLRVQVWMRTARRLQVVAYKTFMRTVLHELCHHLDYEYLKLDRSLHGGGFYRRESSLVRQLLPRTTDAVRPWTSPRRPSSAPLEARP